MSAKPARVSLCMIVRDEEHNLAECLNPVAELFDEIVIVDTGSQDRTKEIAARFTPHVHDFPWCDDFAAARNESLRHASGDWIFWLDADDRIRLEHVGELRRVLEQLRGQPRDKQPEDGRPSDNPLRAFILNTIVPPSDPSEDPLVVSHARLFRRHEKLHWRGRVHEQIKPEFEQLGYERVFTDIEIVHIGYQNAALEERKARRKLRLLRMDYAVDPNEPSTLLHLGMALCRAGKHAEAAQHLRRLVDMNLGAADGMRWVYDALIDLSLLAGNWVEAARLMERGLALFPNDEYLLMALARTFYIKKNYVAAIGVLQRVMQTPTSRKMLYATARNIKTKVAPLMLGAAYRMRRAFADAESTLLGVLAAFPDDCEALFNLGLVYLDQCKKLELVAIVARMEKLPGGRMNAGLLAAMCHLRHGDLGVASQVIDQLIGIDPRHARPRMLRAECLTRLNAPLEDQLRALRDLLRVDPGNVEALYGIERVEESRRWAVPAAIPATATSVVVLPGMAVG